MDAPPNHGGFQLYDPRSGALYYFHTANAATAEADQLGASRFQHRGADGTFMQVDKREGQWIRNDGKPLQLVQQAIDSRAFAALLARAEERMAAFAAQAADSVPDRQHAEWDLYALRSIQDPLLREIAAERMVKVSAVSPGYRARLETARRVVSDNDLVELNAALAASRIAA